MHTAVIAQQQRSDQQDAARAERDELSLGTCIHGKYTVHGVLGHGGFATVYDAVHLGLQRNVAIKVMHVRSDTPVALIERFHREARISALVRHPNVLEVYDTGVLPDGSPYLVMERMNGETLASALARGTLPIAMVFEIGRQLLSALIAIGDAGVVHRDLKPENIMLDHPVDGPPLIKLVDFGISKQTTVESVAPRLTWQGALIGTPQYMSPEQMSGEATDGRTDLYSLGAVLYEALTGRAPHQSDSFSELIVAVLNAPIVAPRKLRRNCPPELEQLLLRALARKPEQRYQTPREMLAELEELVHQLGLPRGSEAFGAVDGADLPRTARAVTARDTDSRSRRLWPLLPSAARLHSKHVYAFAALALALLGAPQLFGTSSAPNREGTKPVAERAAPAVVGASLQATKSPAPGAEHAAPGQAIVEPLADMPVDDSVPVESLPLAKGSLAGARVAHAAPVADEGKEKPARAPSSAKQEVLAPRQPSAVSAVSAARPASAPASASQPQAADRAWEQAMQAALSELVRGSLETARMRYQEAVRIDGSKPAAFRGLGLVAARLGDSRAARAALLRYLELAPNARDAASINARLATLP